jgi:hypothetical protein
MYCVARGLFLLGLHGLDDGARDADGTSLLMAFIEAWTVHRHDLRMRASERANG